MYEYENNYLSFDSPEKVAEFNEDNDVYGHDNDIYKKMGRKHVWNNKNPHWPHCPNPVTAKASSITRLLPEASCSFPEIEKRH